MGVLISWEGAGRSEQLDPVPVGNFAEFVGGGSYGPSGIVSVRTGMLTSSTNRSTSPFEIA